MTTPLIAPRDGITYLKHQEEGVRWMLAREEAGAAVCRGGILGDDMGLGKTFQTIGLLKNGLALRTLIICPPALIAGWTEELKACGYAVGVLMGTAAWSVEDDADMQKTVKPGTTPSRLPAVAGTVKPGTTPSRLPAVAGTVWLTSYPKACLYRRFIGLAEPAFQRIVLDEGHVIRNGKGTARWMNCMAIAKRAVCRWILSATPVQNGPSDWRNLCWWLRVRCPAAMIPELAPTLMLRRTMAELRGDIEALPPPPRFIEHNLSIPEGTKEGKLFRVLCDQAENAMENKSMSALIKLELWMRIQQFVVHPQIYIEAMRTKLGGAYPRPDWPTPEEGGGATKWTECMKELVAGVEAREGTIVFCNFRREMDMVEEAAEALGAEVFAVRGGMGCEKVGEAVAGAKAAALEGKPVVVVVQIVSGGAGLNLQFCQRILFLSQHWNPAVVHQAVGRAVRIGQRAFVQIHLFRIVDDVLDNIDRRMIDLHLRKITDAQEICESLYEGYGACGSVSTKP
jgi:SNF2 family DNA or RNA helicase